MELKTRGKYTTIAISLATKAELDKRKIHPNQSYDEVIFKIMGYMERDRPLKPDILKKKFNEVKPNGNT